MRGEFGCPNFTPLPRFWVRTFLKNLKALAGGHQSMSTPTKIAGVMAQHITHYILRSIPYELFNIQRRKLISICAFRLRTWSYILVCIIDARDFQISTEQPRDGHNLNGSAMDALLESASSISAGLISRTCPLKPTLQRVD
jgi:hypothetical protein